MTKSYVTMEQKVCVVCGHAFDTNHILFDKRMRETFDMHTVTGYGMCPEHQKLKDDGFVALVAVDPEKTQTMTNKDGDAVVKDMRNAYRTGPIAHLRNEAFDKVMNVKRPENGVCFVHPEVIEMLSQLITPTPEVNDDN